MLVVKIELWPKGDKSKAETIGVLTIANDGTGSTGSGNYDCALSHSGKYFGKAGVWKTGRVVDHNRKLSPYHLVLKCLENALSR